MNDPNPDISASLKGILALPLPELDGNDMGYKFDIFTGASLGLDALKSMELTRVEIDAINFHGWNALMYSAYLGHGDICQFLLNIGANAEIANREGQTPLMLASSCGNSEAVKTLLKSYTKLNQSVVNKINQRDVFGRSCLHFAVKYNQLKIVEILLESGADPNLPDCHGMTPTLAACEVGNDQIVSNLLEFRGDPTLKNIVGHDGKDLSTEHPKILRLLHDVAKKNSECTSNEVKQILNKLELEKYLPNFNDNGIKTTEKFMDLDEQCLDNIGITLLGPRKKIMSYVQQNRIKINRAEKSNECNLQQNTHHHNAEKSESGSEFPEILLELEQLRLLCKKQKEEIKKQQEINNRVRGFFSKLLKKGQSSNDETTNNEMEQLVCMIDQINIRLSSFI